MNQLYQQRNLTMLADFYEFTMANGYLESGAGDYDVVFDLFFRRVPEAGGFALKKTHRYGRTALTVYRAKETAEGAEE